MSEMKKDISEMSAAELETHIETLDAAQKRVLKTLRALQRAKAAQEEATGSE